MSKRFVLTLTLLALTCASVAQDARQPQPRAVDPAAEAAALQAQRDKALPSQAATSTCSYTFTTGTGQNYLQSCVTVNGNIVEFQSPKGIESIRIGAYGEGYGVCDASTSTNYYDYADYGDSGNWLAPTTVSSSPTSVKIVRTTSDGVWTLTQIITQTAGTATVKVTMTLKNNTAIARQAWLTRWVDVDADNTPTNNLDNTILTSDGWTSNGYGLQMQNVAPWNYLWNALIFNTFEPPKNVCNPGYASGPLTSTDGSMSLHYLFATVNKESSVTVNLTYHIL
jgi:hypothetical protein